MNEAWIIDACRTPRGIGKPGKGALSGIHPQQLGATVLKDRRRNVRPRIDFVILAQLLTGPASTDRGPAGSWREHPEPHIPAPASRIPAA